MTESDFRQQFPSPPAPPGPEPIPTKAQTMSEVKGATLLSTLGKRWTVAEIEACLERYEGNQHLVCMHLGLIPVKLRAFLREHLESWVPVRIKGEDGKKIEIIPALKAKEEALRIPCGGDKEIMSVPSEIKAEELMRQAEKENEAIKKGMLTLGASAEKAEELLSITKNFKLRHFDKSASFAALGIAVNFTNQLDLLRLFEQRIKDRGTRRPDGTIEPFAVNAKGDLVEESMLIEGYVALSEESRRTGEFFTKLLLALARVQAIGKAQSDKEKKPTTKAGFQPKAALVTAEV